MLIFDADPMFSWDSLLELTGFLSVAHESNAKVKLCVIASLKNCCFSRDGTRLGI